MSITVTDPARAFPFWDAIVSALDVPCVVRQPDMVGYEVRNRLGDDGRTYLIARATVVAVVTDDRHWCCRAPSRAAVDALNAAGIAAGGCDDGPPGLRLACHSAYCATFLMDSDGNRIEAACHHAAGAPGR